MGRDGRERWVEVAAAVAVASLGGPVAGGKAAVGELIKHGLRSWQQDAQTRELREDVANAVRGWARGERFDEAPVRLGLELAGEVFAATEVGKGRIAQLDFDPAAVTKAVLNPEKGSDPYWDVKEPHQPEDHYLVAERAIAVMVGVLVSRVRDDDPVLAVAVERLRATQSDLAVVVDAVDGCASRGEIMRYLRARIGDWDKSVLDLGGRRPSVVRQQLRVVNDGVNDGRVLSEADALAGQARLVILGGPGSGKTWMVRQYARECAQSALQALREGAEIAQVELPVLTTWDAWARMYGEAGEALVAASFEARLGYTHVGDDATVGRLKRTLTRHRRVLACVDSLDESKDEHAQQRWVGLITTPWRVVLTSRPGAWAMVGRPEESSGSPGLVVSVQDLSYPVDVTGFIRAWFADCVEAADRLISQIESRADLRRNAVVPLLLTMYCLLADDPDQVELPRRRRALYRAIVSRMLQGPWTNTPNRVVDDIEACESELAAWAWSAVKDQVTTPGGLGAWEDTFTRPRLRMTGAEADALSHIAPSIARSRDGKFICRFVHRTLLEHFVAEYIAVLDTEVAADVLLPHLWFDPDWAGASPGAIAAHNAEHDHQGVLLAELLRRGWSCGTDDAARAANDELDRILLDIAEQTDPDDWPVSLEGRIHRARVRQATARVGSVAGSAHWTESNLDVVAAITTTLPTADPWSVRHLVQALTTLATSEQSRAIAVQAITTTLPTADPWSVPDLVQALRTLCASPADWIALLQPTEPS